MPQMGESVSEATIVKWNKAVGDSVKVDETILEISTDKVDSEIPSPVAGVIAEIRFAEGDVVPVKQIIAIIEEGASVPDRAPVEDKLPPSNTQSNIEEKSSSSSELADEPDCDSRDGSIISPVVKSLAQQNNVTESELESIQGSGQGGRVTKKDFLEYLATKEGPTSASEGVENNVSVPKSSSADVNPSKPAPLVSAGASAGGSAVSVSTGADKVVPMNAMRRAIANHMVNSKRTSPHVYSVQEVDCSVISKWRNRFKDEFKSKEGLGSFTFTHIFLEATVKALLQFPYLNASIVDNSVVLKGNINLGCAVALPDAGLIVPVIKRAEEKNLVGLARSLNDLSVRARKKKLSPDDVQGGTFTLTNIGGFGTIIGTPIINQPQVGILAVGAIKKRPVVVDDMIAIREMAFMTLSYDHRIVDGAIAGQFLRFIVEYIEGFDTSRSLY